MRRGGACPTELELSRALPIGAALAPPALRTHLDGCAACRSTFDGLSRAVAVARRLPIALPTVARREEVKAALLAAAESGQARGRRRAAHRGLVLAAVAAAAAAIVGIARVRAPRPTDTSPVSGHGRGHVVWRAAPSADADMAAGAAPPDQTLRLRDGTVAVEVAPLDPDERFRVIVGDAEVEVRGTAFTVSAARDRLVGVNVTRGRVEIRPRGRPSAVVGAGESWPLGDVAGDPEPLPPPAAAVPPARPASPRAVADGAAPSGHRARAHIRALEPTPQESQYDNAWDAMRAGDFRQAAAGFAGVVEAAPHGPLADEGAFWQAVALARAGDSPRAVAAFHGMLGAYPGSPRRGEASAMLGWLLVDAHRLDEAVTLFEAAVRDPKATIRASARQGLEAIARARP